MELQDQVYVLSGIVGGLLALVFFFIGYLMYRVARIMEILIGNKVERRDTYAYNNPGIVRGEELNRRGFTMDNHQNAPDQSVLATEPRVQKDYSTNAFESILNNENIIFGGDGLKRMHSLRQARAAAATSRSTIDNNNHLAFQNIEHTVNSPRNNRIQY